uniref:ATP-binding cassette domain-containing protein n=1 Tax=Streptomyces griseus TaxID=1911 RepID=UPI001F3F849E
MADVRLPQPAFRPNPPGVVLESLAVMGPSGSGKSTLLHCLAGIERPDSGEVLLDGERVDQLREPARSELRRTAFGFVFQSGQLLPELPADENVALPLM